MRSAKKILACIGITIVVMAVQMIRYADFYEAFFIPLIFNMAFFMTWGISVRHRILRKEIRMCAVGIADIIVVWNLVRVIRNYFVPGIFYTAKLYLWYTYYIGFIGIPALFFIMSFYMGKGENYKLHKSIKLVPFIGVILFALVMTNNFHQMVFRFHGTLETYDNDYTYGPVYYIIFAWAVILGISGMIIIFRNNRISMPFYEKMLPFIPVALGLLWNGFYSVISDYITTDTTAVNCYIFVAVIEICIQVGLIPSNHRYKEFFSLSNAKGQITDYGNKTVYATKFGQSGKLPEMYNDPSEREIALENGEYIMMHKVKGGYFYYSEDVRELQKVIGEYNVLNDELLDSNVVMWENYQAEKEKLRIEQRQKIFTAVNEEMKTKLADINEYIALFRQTSDDNKKEEYLRKIIVLIAYYKRRTNLNLIGNEKEMVELRELALSFKEVLDNLSLMDVETAMNFRVEGLISIEKATMIFDFYEAFVEENWDDLESLFLTVSKKGDKVLLIMDAESENVVVPPSCQNGSFNKEDEGLWHITYGV